MSKEDSDQTSTSIKASFKDKVKSGLKVVLFYIAGALCFFCALGLAVNRMYPAAGGLVVAGMMLLPIVRTNFKKEVTLFKLKDAHINIICAIGIGVGIFTANSEYQGPDPKVIAAKEAAAKKQQQQAEHDRVIARKDKIIASANALMAKGKYSHAVLDLSEYKDYGDSDLTAAYDRAITGMYAAKTKEYVAELRTIPASEYKKNQDLYQALVEMNPDNAKFQSKLDFYTGKIEEKQKKYDALVEKIGKYPDQFGRQYYAEIALERSAHDPDSIDVTYCTDGRGTASEGWKFKCTYRGKNAFGALVKNTSTFRVKNGYSYMVR